MTKYTILGQKCEICEDETSWQICPYCRDAIDEATTNSIEEASKLAGDPVKFKIWAESNL